MKSIVTISVLVLILGCAHDPSTQSGVQPSVPVNVADAKAIAMTTVRTKEKWKRVDSVAQKLETGWKVFVCQIPAPVVNSYVLVTVNASGQVTHYERQRNNR